MKLKLISICLSLFVLINCNLLFAQSADQSVKVELVPDHSDWVYKIGEPVRVKIKVLQNNALLKNIKIGYEYGQEKMKPAKQDSILLTDGTTELLCGTMTEPGFLRCTAGLKVKGVQYTGLATAAFSPEQIRPTTELPVDFMEFWDKAKAEASKVPIDAKLTLMPENSTEEVNVYHVSIQNYRPGTRLYGMLSVPKSPGLHPAILMVPGAGVRAYRGDLNYSAKGIITFVIGIHGIPVNLEGTIYNDLGKSILANYSFINLDDRDQYYYKRVYLGCLRAIDFIFTLPEFDGTTMAVSGGSQGGALSIVTAGLDKRVKFLSANFPALCDLTGYLYGRAGGWPHMFSEANKSFNVKKDKIETSKYYDVVNFARMIQVPGLYSWGFNDVTCPPTSMYAAFNVIDAPKELTIYKENGHFTIPEQVQKTRDWLLEHLKPVEK